ncbi:hypothetical protein DXG01_011596 [Tephrocybe rancida]|nr:hypothetical protein DXG01_011596 [Tephrocybe rancida]
MHNTLLSYTNQANLPPVLQLAAAAGVHKLHKYEDFAKNNQYYTLGTILHPSLCAHWFRHQKPLKTEGGRL